MVIKRAKVKHWHDYLGGWDIVLEGDDFFEDEIGNEVNISEELINDYVLTRDKYIKICEEIQEIVNKTKRTDK